LTKIELSVWKESGHGIINSEGNGEKKGENDNIENEFR
jgi:hypothetical protein